MCTIKKFGNFLHIYLKTQQLKAARRINIHRKQSRFLTYQIEVFGLQSICNEQGALANYWPNLTNGGRLNNVDLCARTNAGNCFGGACSGKSCKNDILLSAKNDSVTALMRASGLRWRRLKDKYE